VDVQIWGHRGVDLVKKPDELNRTMSGLAGTNHLACRGIERREQ
jgi:hypothetical protein